MRLWRWCVLGEREESERELEPMIIARLLRNASIAAGAIVAAMSLASGSASAQLFWDWGGGGTIGGSGREFVRFSPQFKKGEIVVSFGDRRLYFVTAPGQAISYPIAVPREESRWAGVTSVTSKRINPSWTPTPTMMAENPRLPRWVPGGHPMNPLGVRALYLGSSTYRIHGTDAPWTIGTAVSKGCIRMYNQDVLDLYPRANVGAKVTVTWNRFDGGAATSSSGSGGGGFFSIFGNDDPPTEKPRPRPARDKSASSS
jgi:lipoprotein-anchoring transpeptidase ErfK/SrfK